MAYGPFIPLCPKRGGAPKGIYAADILEYGTGPPYKNTFRFLGISEEERGAFFRFLYLMINDQKNSQRPDVYGKMGPIGDGDELLEDSKIGISVPISAPYKSKPSKP